jgi:hypothetical protein
VAPPKIPAHGKKLSEKLKMLPKLTGPYFVKINFYTHTANTIRELDTYYFSI